MSDKKQSSVEWFNEELNRIVDKYGYISKKMLSIHFNRAKKMYKQEIIDAANNGCKGMCYLDSPREGQQYYNETFGGNNE